MIEVRLQCDHLLRWRTLSHAPKTGERVYCHECKDMRAVISRTGEWAVRCQGCRWQKAYVRVEYMRDRVVEHINSCGSPIDIENHDRTERYTVRTARAARHAASDGDHSASVAATARVLPPETLF